MWLNRSPLYQHTGSHNHIKMHAYAIVSTRGGNYYHNYIMVQAAGHLQDMHAVYMWTLKSLGPTIATYCGCLPIIEQLS